jgi:hypothetical protein
MSRGAKTLDRPHQAARLELGVLVGAPRTVITGAAVIVCAKVDCLAAKSAAVVDERLVLLDRHCVKRKGCALPVRCLLW